MPKDNNEGTIEVEDKTKDKETLFKLWHVIGCLVGSGSHFPLPFFTSKIKLFCLFKGFRFILNIL